MGKTGYLLGISCYFHDSAAVLLHQGKLVAAAEEERFTRVKHDNRFPSEAIRYVLSEGKITLEDIDSLVFYEKPLLKFDRIMETTLAKSPKKLLVFLKSFSPWISKNLFCKRAIIQDLKSINPDLVPPRGWILFSDHHLSHASSAYYPSPFNDAAVICADGVGEWTTTSIWHGRNEKLEPIKRIDYPDSLGLFYSAFTSFCGFRVLSGEYKLMGLAAFGKPKFTELIKEEVINIFEDGSFKINSKYLDFFSHSRMYTSSLQSLLGVPPLSLGQEVSPVYADIAASCQAVLEEIMLKIAIHAREITGSENLCLAGGVALNCKANQVILEKAGFKELWLQPASGDSGGALGAALSVWNSSTNNRTLNIMGSSCWGPEFSEDEIQATLSDLGIPYKALNEKELVETASDLLAQSKVVGWFQGRMEFGPRALGNRSILADPRDPSMKDHLNRKIKFRESFRPFAPAILEEDFYSHFDGQPNPYMLITARSKPQEDTSGHPNAAIHLDGTARVQTVSTSHRKFHNLIHSFKEKTGCPALLNTSFNLRGEPIACTPLDALKTFAYSEIDYLFLGSSMISRADLHEDHFVRIGPIKRVGD